MLGLFGAVAAIGAGESHARKIIVLKEGIQNQPALEALLKKFNGVKLKELPLVNGAAVLLPEKAVVAVAKEDVVLRVDDDVIVEAIGKPAPVQPAQSTPWGIERVEALVAWSASVGAGVNVGVIDTGIDLTHPDLSANIKGGYNAIDATKSANDDNGHGTHVAGTIAAINNNIGVVGVAPGANLYAIKVLDRRGSGYLSDIIDGLDWAIQHGMKVVNMSLGTSADVQSFHDAVMRVRAAGIMQVVAAGNSGSGVSFPGAYAEVITVSATDNTNTIASFSSRGPAVDLAAPGVNIYSTYKGRTYQTLNGTSMAAPHVTGGVAALLAVPAKCDLDFNGLCDPSEVQQHLESTAKDLGLAGKDSLYGAGLLDVAKAVLQ